MYLEVLPALALFAFASSVTPGPNNLMVMASGANFGFWRSLPHMLGISLGFLLMLVLAGAGLSGIFARYPASLVVLKVLSILYMLYLAWKIATAAPLRPGDGTGRPMTFLQAAAFQWVNPKAWAMALTALTVHVGDHGTAMLIAAAALFAAINLPSITLWTVAGLQMKRFLTSPARLRAFNVTMAVLLILSLYPLLQLG